MGYRIEYGKEKKYTEHRKDPRKWMIIGICVAVLAIILEFTGVREKLIPGDAAVTAAAFEELVMDLKAGEPGAFAAFCREIVEHAQLPD